MFRARHVESTIETERLRLEPLVALHAYELFGPLSAPEIYRYMPLAPPISCSALAARYDRLATRRSPDGRERWLNWAVRVRIAGHCIGRIEATVREDGVTQIAYLFAPSAHGRGYATEACRSMISTLAQELGVQTYEAIIDVRNERSLA